ncbi:hypothetical protein [Friedmanniella luteola]|uniref:hypothetical protein n=1 Tax=Friedmanniella luteola TaxID=546871 RepID=UPI000B84F9CB|nr:hypothetical protein [Friedmanniella luteola]
MLGLVYLKFLMKLLRLDPRWVYSTEIDARQVVIAATPDELALIANSLNESLEAIEDWEFQTRLGESHEAARALRSQISGLLDQLREVE